MTEYEIADLAISRGLEIHALTANYQAMIDSRGVLTQQFMTVLFAYLAAAYFIGATLSRKHLSLSAISLRRSWKWRIIANWKSRPWRHDSNKGVSGIPGAIHVHLRIQWFQHQIVRGTLWPLMQEVQKIARRKRP